MSAALLFAACGVADRTPRCVMGEEHTVGAANGWSFDQLALTTIATTSYAFWSDAGGLYGATLDATGKRAASPRRIGERCTGGLAAVAHDGSIAVACLRPLTGTDAAGDAQLLQFAPDLRLLKQRTLGSAGRASQDIEVSVSEAGQLAVVWQDASIDGARVWLWRGAEEAEQLILSSASSIPSAPTLAWLGTRLFVGWSEASHDAREKSQRLVLSRGEGAPTVVATVTYIHPTPRLRTVSSQLYISFRDLRDRVRKPGLYVSRISEQGNQVGDMTRVLRANGKAGQALVPCFGGLLAVAPRIIGGGSLISIGWADSTLTHKSAERQYYEDSRQFVLASATCVDDRALLLIAEQGGPTRPAAQLRSVGFRCE